MLLPDTLYIFCIHLTIVVQIHSYVLITANVEDVKRLARKFIPDTLAEQLAEYIARAGSNINTNVSEENEENAVTMEDIPNNELKSNKKKKKEQQPNRSIKMAVTTKTTREETTTKPDYVWNKKMEFKKKRKSRFNTVTDKNKLTSVTNRQPPLVGHAVKQYPYSVNEFLKPKQTKEANEQYFISQNKAKNIWYPSARPTADSTLGYEEIEGSDENLSSSQTKRLKSKRKPKKREFISTEEDTPTEANLNDKMSKPKMLIEFSNNVSRYVDLKLNSASPDLTTEKIKARNDFDHYDFSKYPKPELIATSGPVALPKFDGDKPWWPAGYRKNEDQQNYSDE